MSIEKKLAESLVTGFVDCNLNSLEKYHPKLLVNDYKRGMKVLTSLISELEACDEFYFSVAFITESGVISLLKTLKELELKNIKGKIITGQYQNFTQPKALKRLTSLSNIEVKIATERNFHAKGYIFKKKETFSFIIGSSNLTQYALSSNQEWNLKMSSLENGLIMQSILKEFNYTFNNGTIVNDRWIEEYSKIYYDEQKIQKNIEGNIISLQKIYPNKMQMDALRALELLRNGGKRKGLVISATGTGKTYLSAFDVAKVKPEKFLFIVHRENIAKASLRSYKKILGENINAGILSGTEKNIECDFIFATVQTISKRNYLEAFGKTHFDYIVIDEVHRSGSESYQRILNYFTPKFLLGMTATPERTDGFDIFRAFDYNLAYEIRLNRALEENMLAPFHYFGVSEVKVDGEILDENADFAKLTKSDRLKHIIETIKEYGWYGDRVKGLIFCSRIEEAKWLSQQLNERGYFTTYLEGSSNELLREDSIKKLEQETRDGGLDYIITVDIFNEGVDIPSVNQIVMLRPTQSAIVFVQQLGRGLRKVLNKEYLTVIDFIGNYKNNYMVPIALYGDKSFNKDTLRKLINSGSSLVPGCSTINFDKITKEKIFESINTSTFSTLKNLKKDFELLKFELGRLPLMMDFIEHGRRNPSAFVDYSNSYYGFLQKINEPNISVLNSQKIQLLEFFSKEILNGKRIEESIILAMLIGKGQTNSDEINTVINERFSFDADLLSLNSAVANLNGAFLKDNDVNKYQIEQWIFESDDGWHASSKMVKLLIDEDLHVFIDDMIRYSLAIFSQTYRKENFRRGFTLYNKYSRKDVCRILNWSKNEESTIYGYRIKNSSCPIFVTYHKNEDISDSTKYEDKFLSPFKFSWMTRNRVTLESEEVKKLQAYKETRLRIPLFVKKSDGEGSDFYYMGDLTPVDFTQTEIAGGGERKLSIVNIVFNMVDVVEDSIYTYFEK